MTRRGKRLWIERALALGVIAAGAAAAIRFHGGGGFDWSVDSLRGVIAELGWLGPAALIAMMALRPFLALPSALVLLAAGMLFGPMLGTLYGALGGLLGAWIAFWLARSLGREAVAARLGGGQIVQRFDRHLSERGTPWLATWTALPVTPLTPVFFTAGVTQMGYLPFGTAIGAGFLPRAGVYAFWGQTFGEPTMANLVAASGLFLVCAAGVWAGRHTLRVRSEHRHAAQTNTVRRD